MPSCEVSNVEVLPEKAAVVADSGKSRKKSQKVKKKSKFVENNNNNNNNVKSSNNDASICRPLTNVQCVALRDMRSWVSSQPHLRGVRTDDSFLLRFLRFQKWRTPDARNVLDKYVQMRANHPEWFSRLDIRDPKLRGLLTSGYLLPLPGRDPRTGRRVLFSRAAAMDTSVYTACDVMRAHILAYEALLCDDDVQERGLTYVFDERDVNWRHIAIWSPGEISKAFHCCERALPLRHQEIHFVHLPWTMHLVFQFAKSLLSQKLRERFQTHSSFEKLSEDEEDFPSNMLPEGYFGSAGLSEEEMIKRWVEELEEKRDAVLGLDNMSYEATKETPSGEGGETSSDGVLDLVGSVRKMESGNKGR